jgi:hypothetical protein
VPIEWKMAAGTPAAIFVVSLANLIVKISFMCRQITASSAEFVNCIALKKAAQSFTEPEKSDGAMKKSIARLAAS